MLVVSVISWAIDAWPSFTGKGLSVPVWVWVVISLSGIPIAQFLAFKDVRDQREVLQKQLDSLRDDLLGNLSVDNLHFGFGNFLKDSINVQPGIRLLNSAGIPIRYDVVEISAIVANHTIGNPAIRMRTGVIPSGKERLFLYPVIPDVPKKFPAECTIRYVVQYGPVAEEYSHELSEALTVTMNIIESPDMRIGWVYLIDSSQHRRL